MSGTLLSTSGEQLRLRVPPPANVVVGPAQELAIPLADVVRFERREFSRTRTAIAVAGSIAGITALYIGFEKGNPFSQDDPEDPEQEEPFTRRFARILRITIPMR